MVSFRLVLAAVASHLLLASSAPTSPILARDLVPRAEVEVKYCEKTNWDGECRTVTVTEATCMNMLDAWNDRVSSIKNVDKDEFKCTWYMDANCTGESYDNQEDADLGDGNGRFDEVISSYICVPR
ncbi:hypothetical protein B0T16DRAFT_133867 [Cercophora newfieldiana]|uniref:Uncharacterized protein n=1 Tax=Cercophora newfieldiana TaxID=92897 RepID=A0AA39YBH8_9PEZI|nr:hypothetical protein B0T16DRAFT_133867 [Cercophora newfieldiana]